jgi:hypothetical protein
MPIDVFFFSRCLLFVTIVVFIDIAININNNVDAAVIITVYYSSLLRRHKEGITSNLH